MRARVGLALLLASAALSASREACADADDDRVARGRASLEDQRYDAAIHDVQPLLKAQSTPRRVRVQALEITAIAHLVLGRFAQARGPLTKLYDLAPGFALEDPSLPPRVTAAFDAEAALPHARAVTPSLQAVGDESKDLQEFRIAVAGTEAKDVRVTCRAGDTAPFATVVSEGSASGAGDVTAFRYRLPTPVRHGCQAVAVDADQLPLGRLGTAREPFFVEPRHPVVVQLAPVPPAPKKEEGSIAGKWWFWTAGAALIAGTVAIVYVSTRPNEASPPAADITTTAKAFAW
jgi:hypothetical protein